MHPAEHTEVERWLARHGLADAEPTPLLATRLAVRRRAKVADALLLAAFMMGAALTHALGLPTTVTSSWLLLLVLASLAVGLLVAQWLLGWWVRRVDQRAGAQLPGASPTRPSSAGRRCWAGRTPSSRSRPSPARSCSR